jgi:hypothetical protein
MTFLTLARPRRQGGRNGCRWRPPCATGPTTTTGASAARRWAPCAPRGLACGKLAFGPGHVRPCRRYSAISVGKTVPRTCRAEMYIGAQMPARPLPPCRPGARRFANWPRPNSARVQPRGPGGHNTTLGMSTAICRGPGRESEAALTLHRGTRCSVVRGALRAVCAAWGNLLAVPGGDSG